MKYFLFLVCCISSLFALEISTGKTLFLHVKDIDKNSKVHFLDREFTPLSIQKKKVAIIPIDYKMEKGNFTLFYFSDGLKKEIAVHVKDGKYPKETLQVDPKKVKPPKKYLDQIYSEYKEASNIYKTKTPTLFATKPFDYPLNSKITSHYGNARIFNKHLKSYHSGTDFRAKVGTPIKAINDGIVVLAKHRYYAGGSVIIDHGQGIYSCYYHLSDFKVKPNQKVAQGEIIALSGKSGRVTGPHLHFTVKLNTHSVDPLDFIDSYNKLFSSY